MTARKQVMVFSMGAMALITLATTIIVGAHYWEMLSGVWLIAIVGLCLPDWVAWWSTYWHAKATKDGQEDPAVKWTTLVVSALMSLVMILNAGAVLAVWWETKSKAEAQKRDSDAQTAMETVKQTGQKSRIEARGQQVLKMKEAGMTDRAIREYMKSEASRDKSATLTAGSLETTPAAQSGEASQVPEPVRKYMAFWVYIIPFLAGLFGLFANVIAIALPGGVEFGEKKTDQDGEKSAQPRRIHPLSPAGATAKADHDPKA